MKKYFTIPEAAKLMGISRIALYKQVKAGKVQAERTGKIYMLASDDISEILGKKLSKKDVEKIDRAVDMIFKEYGEALKLLGKE